jgi:hypothetical protein
MKGVLKEKDFRAKSAQSSIMEAQEVLSSSIGKATGAYEKLNIEKGDMTQDAGMVAAESSETIDFILANFEEASTGLGNSNDALENIAEDISTLNELDADAKVVSDSFEEFVKETLNVLEDIDREINGQGKIISEVADQTEVDASHAEELADRIKEAQETRYENKKLAKEAKERALSDATEAALAYKDAVKVSDSVKAALDKAIELKNSADDKVNDARVAYNNAQAKADLAREELNIIMTENGLDPYADGFDGDVKVAVDNAQSALEKANEAANIAAIDLIGRQYELAEAEGKLAVAKTKEGYAQDNAIDSLRNVLNKTVEAIQATNDSAISAKEAVNDAYDAVMRSADQMRMISLQAQVDLASFEKAKARRDEARKVYLEAIEAKDIAEENVRRAKEAAKLASDLADMEFIYGTGSNKVGQTGGKSIFGAAINSLFGSKNKQKQHYSHKSM